MSDNEIYTRMCVRYGWTEQEQEERRRRAAAMQEKLLRSIVKRSIELDTDAHSYYQIVVNPAGALIDHDRR